MSSGGNARISINQGKTQVWNWSGETPSDCEHLFFNANGEPSGVCGAVTTIFPLTSRASPFSALQ